MSHSVEPATKLRWYSDLPNLLCSRLIRPSHVVKCIPWLFFNRHFSVIDNLDFPRRRTPTGRPVTPSVQIDETTVQTKKSSLYH
ncbi:hypothetical protein BC938DRAFT_480455 [Jimgerdemannia flammicorona]|uniref:Uncharacterized protein n=1 Tax=Jimgerdemannia flammicorona TaxID=994334 RepID=A0A433QIF6_9FUNG|nr:hypothetical protein BC938DRAFT_480455 [Jimgerdemannia flammicorona]